MFCGTVHKHVVSMDIYGLLCKHPVQRLGNFNPKPCYMLQKEEKYQLRWLPVNGNLNHPIFQAIRSQNGTPDLARRQGEKVGR
jgi:hypothetical protein